MIEDRPLVVVPAIDGGGSLDRLGDRLVEIEISDPDRRLGRSVRIEIARRDPRRPSPIRSALLDRRGSGRFLGWLPEDPVGLSITAGGADAVRDGRPPTARLIPVSLVRMVLLAVLCRPLALFRVLRLYSCGNRKGAVARFVRLFDAIAAPSHRDWVALRDAEDARSRPGRIDEIATWPWRPTVVVKVAPGPRAARAETLRTLREQIYPAIRVVDGDDAVEGDLVTEVAAGVRLHPDAIWHLARPFAFDAGTAATYCDEDEIDRFDRPRRPVFHPCWSPALAEAGGLAPALVLVRRGLASVGAEEPANMGRLLLAVAAEGSTVISHVPRVLAHRPSAPRRPPSPLRPVPRLAEGERSSVSVVVPTRDRADLLAACVDGLLARTDGVDADLVIVDNGSREAATAALYERLERDPRIRRIERPGPFNFPNLVGAGVAVARHDLVLLLNNDVEPMEPNWLRAMIAELSEPRVGIVGARLLFPDGHVQHGGVTLGAGGIARHTFHFFGLRDGEDHGLLAMRRDVSAVTAACLLTRKSLWDRLGGMDGDAFAVAYNDVDFCLRVRASGMRVVWTPEATLVHRESVTRGPVDTPEKRERFVAEEAEMTARWSDVLANDPFHNPNLSLVADPFVPEVLPRDRRARSSV